MACFTIPSPIGGSLNLTIPVVSSIINALLAYQEYKIYDAQKDSLEGLADRNMSMGDEMSALKNEVRGKRVELYDRLNNTPLYDECCEDAKSALATVMGKATENYSDALEQMGWHQAGKIQSAHQKVMRHIPEAHARVAEALYKERKFKQMLDQNRTRAITTSSHHADMPSPSIYSRLAQTHAENLNDAVDNFNVFWNEATRLAGYAYEVNKPENREFTAQLEQQNQKIENTIFQNPQTNTRPSVWGDE